MKTKTPPINSRIFFILSLFFGFFQLAFAQVDYVGTTDTGSITTGAPFKVTIALQSNGQLIDAAEAHLKFDPAILQVNSVTTASSNPLTTLFVPAAFDNSAGTIDFAAGVQTPPATPVDANFDVLVIEFEASQSGSTSLNFVNPNPPIALTVAYLAGVDVLNIPNPINLVVGTANNPPTADFTATPNPAETDEIISFNAATSSDPDVGDVLTYSWNFGDGTTGNGLTIDHTYTAANTYNVSLTVSDGNGGSDTEIKQIVVNVPTVTSYTITASSGPNGSITPDASTSVIAGGNQSYSIVADANYEVADVLVNGNSVGAVTSYDFTNVNANATISATFSAVDTTPIISLAATASVDEMGNLSVPLSITDTDGDNLTVSFSSSSDEPQLLQTSNSGKQVDPFPFDADSFFTQSGTSSSAGNYVANLDFSPVFGDGGGADGDGSGTYTITVSVDDEDGNTITKDLILTVNDVAQFISESAITRIEAESFDNQGPPHTGSGNNGIGVEIDPAGFTNIGYTHLGNFMEFEIDVETTGLYTFDMLVAAPGTAGVLTAKTMDITSSLGGSSTFTVTSTGGWGAYEEQSIDVILQAGPQTLRFEWTGGGNGYLFNIDYFDVEFLSVVDNPPTIDPIADVEIEENAPINILISVNDDTNTSASIVIYDKSINTTPNNTNTDPYTSGGTITGYSFTESPSDSGNYTLVFASGIADSRSYFARVTADDGSNPPVNETFNIDVAHSVSNDVLTASVLDATTFSDPLPWYGNNPQAPFSVSIENSGTNIGYIENGEFVEYLIYVPTAGPYEITLKSANGSGANGSSTNIDILEEGNATPIGLVTVPKTTWGNYQDYTTTVSFTNSGLQTLRLVFDGGVNSQTISFKPSNTNSAPVVNISAPNDGIALTSGTSLDFIAAATDFQEGDLSSTISWTSDLDGALGTGASVSSALTTVGTHVITAEATDNDVIPLTGSNTITLLVTESDPTCDARFRVNAGGPALLANSGNFEEDQASAAADAGNTAQPGTPSPYLDLTAPAIDKTFGSTVALVANTTGYPDYLFQTERFSTQGNTNNMNWSFPTGDGIFEVKILFNENWGGELNNPRVFDVEIEGDVALDDYRPSVDGTQINIAKVETYLATVEDGILNVNFIQGTQNPSVKGFDICYVSDLPTDTPPSIVINSPTTNGAPTSVVRGTQINLAATATDQEDDDTTLTSNINWSIDPFEPSFGGSGGSFTDELFIPGTYTITATVTDDDGNEVSDDIELTIEGPDVDFVFPADGAIVNDTELMVTWTALNMFLEGPNNEHFHIWVNPTDTDNLVTADRISTASVPEQLFWNIGATDGIVEGQNTLVILAAESGHDDFTSVEAKDIVTFTVSIPDTTDPEIECPEDIVVSNDEGDCGAVVNYSVPVGTDDKPGVVTSLISGLASGESFPLGTTTVTYEVVDAAGNDAQCSFTVTVNDDEAPEIICPPDISVVSLDGSPINIADIGMATATDNCDTGLTVSSVVLGSTDPIPSFFPVGPTTIQWSTVDAAGNPAFCNQTITVTFTPSSDNDITEFTLPGQTGPTAISGTDIAITMPVGSDVTNLVPASLVFSAGASISPAVGDAQDFSVPVDYTVTAQDNSTKTYTVNVTVLEDTTDPEVVCPDDIIVSTDENECGAIVNYTIPVGTDDQPGVTTFLLYGLESGEFFPLGDTLIVYEVQDAAGNNANCSFKVTVNDDEAPEIICPPDISVVSLDGSPINIADIGMATATDNCDTGLTVSSVVLGSTDPIPAFFPVGPTTIQWSTVDAAGNPAFCNQTITVTFTPSSDNDITEFTLPGQTGPTAISGTDIAITMPLGSNVTNLVPASLVFSPGATISPVAGAPQDFSSPVDYVVTAQDNSTQTYTVNVTVEQDTTDPEVECPEDIVVSNDAGDCGAVVNFMASATDDQPGVTTSASIPSGSVFPVGTTTVTVTATDAAGNTAECTFDITVNDVEPPTAICSDTTITLNSSGIANIDPNVLASDSSDACGISSITASQTTFSQADIGLNTITLTITDLTGNTSTCNSIVNVEEAVIVGTAELTVLDATTDTPLFDLFDGMVIQKSDIGNTPLGVIFNTDYNPGGVYFILTGPLTESRNEGPTPHSLFGDIGVDIQGKVFPIGDYTLIANPVNGPTLTVNFSVVDGPDPCEDFDVTLDAADGTLTCGGTEGKISISVSGASLPLTYSWSHDNSLQSDSALNLSAGTYSVTVTDANGCSDSVTATLSDPAGPSVQLGATSDPSTCGGADGSIAISAIGAEPMTYVWSHDNALQSAVAAGLSAGSYVVTVTDANGCSETVSTTLSDPSAPNVTLGSFSSVLESDAPFSLSGGSPSGGFYSGQGVTNGVFDPSVGPGSYVITYNYTDSSTGCEGSATATIQVNVDTPPTMELVSFTLVNADNDQDIVTLTDGINILIEDLPTTNLNIRANTAGNVGSVSMSLSGSQTKTMVESVAPYALYGDFPAGDYYAGNLGVGNYVISGTPYSLSGAAGTAGISLTIEFEISEESFLLRLASPKEMIISPNPVDRIATVVFETPKRVATIYLYDGSGRLAKVHYGDPGKEVSIEQVPVQDLPGGIYYVRTVDSSGRQFQQQMAINR